MSLDGIQNSVQTNTESFSATFSSATFTGGSTVNPFSGGSVDAQQLKGIFNSLFQGLEGIEAGSPSNTAQQNSAAETEGAENSGSNPIQDLLKQIVNLLKSLVEKGGAEQTGNQTAPEQTGEKEPSFLEKLLSGPLELAKSLFGGGEGGGGILGGLFGGK